MMAVAENRSRRGKWGGARPGAGRKAELADPAHVGTAIEREELEQLDALARERNLTRAQLLREIISGYLKRIT
jgi:hypothetical protein